MGSFFSLIKIKLCSSYNYFMPVLYKICYKIFCAECPGASLYKGNVIINGRESPSSLYNKELSSMDIEGGFDQKDSAGFIKINAIRLMAHHAITKRQGKTT